MQLSASPEEQFVVALDIGSGACKAALLLLRIQGERDSRNRPVVGQSVDDETPAVTIKQLYGREVVCLVGHSVIASSPTTSGSAETQRRIPDDAVARLHDALQLVLSESRESFRAYVSLIGRTAKGATEKDWETLWETNVRRIGIATAVFRETTNGPAVLKHLSERFRCSLVVASQQLEGIIGYRTGCLAIANFRAPDASHPAYRSQRRLGSRYRSRAFVVWDSGGASFQLTLERFHSSSGLPPRRELAAYEGRWGSSKAMRAVVEDIQGRSFPSSSSNPMSLDDVMRSIQYFTADLQKCEAEKMTTVNVGGGESCAFLSENDLRLAVALREAGGEELSVVGVGGPTSAFRMSSMLERLGRNGSTQSGPFSNEQPSPPMTFDSLLKYLVTHIVNRSDAEIGEGGFGFPQPEMVGPKICLVLSVLQFFSIGSFRYFPTIGSTLGIAEASVTSVADEFGVAMKGDAGAASKL